MQHHSSVHESFNVGGRARSVSMPESFNVGCRATGNAE